MAERARVYPYNYVSAITPHDTNETIKGARYIQCAVAGNIVFLHRDASTSDAIPLAVNQSFELGYQHVGIHTSTTATGILAYWDLDVDAGPLV